MSGMWKALLKEAVSGHFKPCGVERCAKHSLGAVCSRCSKFACLEHVYFTAPTIQEAVPQAVCEDCIGELYRERTKKRKQVAA